MELDITHFFNEADPYDYSASRAEKGENAGRITWEASCADAEIYGAWLDSEDKREIFRGELKSYGAWDEAEIRAMSDRELTALLMQMIAGDIRDGSLDALVPDWEEYERGAEAGRYSGRIYKSGDRVYYYIGD